MCEEWLPIAEHKKKQMNKWNICYKGELKLTNQHKKNIEEYAYTILE